MRIVSKKTLLATLIATTNGLPGIALANTERSDKTDLLETIVVVGQATNVLVSSEDLRSYQANDLSDIFRMTPSVTVGGSLGIAQKIYIRGLEDTFINVTVDGAPQTSTLFHHIGRVSIAPELLKDVEVQAGAGEATSGAGAIGGAIRFKTKDLNDLLPEQQAFGGTIKAGYFSNDGEQYSASLYGRLTDNWGVVGYYSDTNRNNFKDGGGDEVLGTASNQSLGFVKISGDITDNQYLSLSFEDRDEDADFSKNPNWYVPDGTALYASEAKRDTYVLNYTWQRDELVNIEVSLYDTTSSFQGGAYNWLSEITSRGFDIRNTSQFDDHRFTYGVDYRGDESEAGGVYRGYVSRAKEESSVLGVYAQAYSQLTEQLLLSYGARYDDYSYEQVPLGGEGAAPTEFDDDNVSFNVGLSYDLSDAWVLGLGYAEAFRGKEIGDGFTLTDAPFGGSLPDDFNGESVSNIEASAEYSSEKLNVKMAVFQSVVDDVIFEIPDRKSGYYQNIGALETQGFEFEVNYRLLTGLEAYIGFSSVESEIDFDTVQVTPGNRIPVNVNMPTSPVNGYEHKGLGNSSGDSWNIGLNYTPRTDLRLGVNVAHVEELKINTLYIDQVVWGTQPYKLKKPSYTTVDIFAEWQAYDGLVFNLAVINMFDKDYIDHASVGDYSEVSGYASIVGPAEAGRDIRLSASYSF